MSKSGKGPSGNPPNSPSKTGKPSGGGRGNNPPKQKLGKDFIKRVIGGSRGQR